MAKSLSHSGTFVLIPSHIVMKNHPNWKPIICGVKASDQIL